MLIGAGSITVDHYAANDDRSRSITVDHHAANADRSRQYYG